MTPTTELIALSEEAAKIVGIDTYKELHGVVTKVFPVESNRTYIYQDNDACMKLLCWLMRLGWKPIVTEYLAVMGSPAIGENVNEYIANHPTTEQAVCVAILRAVVAQGRE